VLRIKFCGSRQFSDSESPTSCSYKTLVVILKNIHQRKMEYCVKLHHDIKLSSDTLMAASQHLDIKLEFVEKDYWITLVLSRLAKSKYVDESVFKGGTSLSKGYNLIERFSEDVDIAIINDKGKTGNEIKSFKSLLSQSSKIRDYQYSEMDEGTNDSWTISNGEFKLIVNANGNEVLYDLINDPYESKDLLTGTLTTREANAKVALESELLKIRN